MKVTVKHEPLVITEVTVTFTPEEASGLKYLANDKSTQTTSVEAQRLQGPLWSALDSQGVEVI